MGRKTEFLSLQLRIVNRHISDAGLRPLAGWLLAALLFAVLSSILYLKTGFASWILTLLLPGMLTRLSGKERNEMISMLFSGSDRVIIRIAENLLVTIPFAVVLTVAEAWLPLGVAFGTSIVMALSVFSLTAAVVIPTPFGRWPYEFPAGFRRSWPAIAFSLFLCLMSVVSGNFNLSVFAQLCLTVVVIAFYLQADPEIYVQMFSCRPRTFLVKKIVTAAGCSVLLAAPVMIASMAAFPDRWWIPPVVHAIAMLYLAAVILLRYASFPGEPGVPGLIILALAVSFPPLLLVVIPYFGARAVRHLKPLLQ